MMIDAQRRWFAVRVKPRHEHSVAEALRGRGLEEFLPLYTRKAQWSDRLKLVQSPLFPQYTFCRLGEAEHSLVRLVPGVRSIVGFNHHPMPVEDAEIDAVRTLVDSHLVLVPLGPLGVGQRVQVVKGPLFGCEGVLEGFKSRQRLVVTVSLLGRSVGVEIDPSWVVVIEPSWPAGRERAGLLGAGTPHRLRRGRGNEHRTRSRP
ncbi:MAG: UpxY family transcription antiterminator [Acidobacteria bacterium]|nr:UpxY family transcription antiterminator [Acidobacteriota bacterium]